MGDEAQGRELHATVGRLMRVRRDWSYFFLSGHPRFQELIGHHASRNRKLYNGDLKCYFYQYFGPFPPATSDGPDAPEA